MRLLSAARDGPIVRAWRLWEGPKLSIASNRKAGPYAHDRDGHVW
jgi:hypothetical protein